MVAVSSNMFAVVATLAVFAAHSLPPTSAQEPNPTYPPIRPVPTTSPPPTTPAPIPACGNGFSIGSCPSGMFCEPVSPTLSTCSTAYQSKCGVVEPNYDYYGNDIKSVLAGNTTECCDICARTSGCAAYTQYSHDGATNIKRCYLKSAIGERRSGVGVISGALVAPSACPNFAYGQCGSGADFPTPVSNGECCPVNHYCQPWDLNTYRCIPKPARCSRQFTGVDFSGEDAASGAIYVTGPEECCTLCGKTNGCKAYTYVNDDAAGKPACYLKKGPGLSRINGHAVSGMLD